MTRRSKIVCGLACGLALAAAPFARGPTPRTVVASDGSTFVVRATPFERQVDATGNLEAVTATPIASPELADLGGALTISWLMPSGTQVRAGDVVARFDRVAAEKQLVDARAMLAAADARLAEARIQAASSAADKAAAAASATRAAGQARNAAATDPLLNSRNQIIEAGLDQKLADAQQAQAERARTTDRRVSRSNIELAAIDRKRYAVQVEHYEEVLTHLELRAPHDGLFVLGRDDRGEPWKLGAHVWQGQQIAELPELDKMEAELFVLEVDGSGLEEGQPAQVIVDSHPELVFRGTVRTVDKLAKPRESWVPTQYFTVKVALERTDAAVMKLGQRVHAVIGIGHVDRALLVPRQAVIDAGGKTVVYRPGGEAVAVEVGPATPGRVAVTSGLADGDRISLRGAP